MQERAQESNTTTPDAVTGYEAPVVEDLETPDGPAVTAAGVQSGKSGPR